MAMIPAGILRVKNCVDFGIDASGGIIFNCLFCKISFIYYFCAGASSAHY
jgi:hypothetical protein